MNKVMLGAGCLVLGALTSFARTVMTDTVVANPGATVVVPVRVDSVADAASATVTIGYDATVLVCLGAEEGELAKPGDMTYLDSGSGRICAVFTGFRGTGGVLAYLRFAVREGTQGLFSDVTVQDAGFGSPDGVSDLSVVHPVSLVNGMVRVVAPEAEIRQLEEHFVVWPNTAVKTVALSGQDKIKAADDGTPIRVTQGVSASGVITVEEPVGGWQSGRYELLATPTENLTIGLEGATNLTLGVTRTGGVSIYWAEVVVEGDVTVSAESGELSPVVIAQIRKALASDLAAHPEVKTVVVKGDMDVIPVVVDLGIAPQVDILGTTASVTYAKPTLKIIAFDPATGSVRIKVTPGEGNTIRSVMATGCLHVYGTDDLKSKMRYISGVSFDLTPYLGESTRGEADLTVALGAHTFIKLKAETLIKKEGDIE